MVRSARTAPASCARRVAVRRVDFGAPETLPDAFRGAATVFLNATYYGAPPEVRGAQLAGAIAAAEAAGAARIVVTSWQDADACPMPATADFPATERRLGESAARWTVLRVGYGLAAALARDVVTARRAGELAVPAGVARIAA
ncbi:NAD(P)H-binding protein, partial [Dactylosporangium sp. NPDC005572]|uniref:NAD(P)H-binding protein n=1 Tax=Dactylosporangium sp. NPDC005572 TaxID=3156889 RepID=UPI0033A83567